MTLKSRRFKVGRLKSVIHTLTSQQNIERLLRILAIIVALLGLGVFKFPTSAEQQYQIQLSR